MTSVLLREEMPVWTCGKKRLQDFGVHSLQANRAAHGPSAARTCKAATSRRQVLFAHLFSQQERGGSAKWTHAHKHRAEATTQGKQEQQGPEGPRSCTGKGTGVTLGATGATLEVGERKEVLHKVRHGTYVTEEHSDGARGAQDMMGR